MRKVSGQVHHRLQYYEAIGCLQPIPCHLQNMLLNAGMAAYEDLLFTTGTMYNLMVTYGFTQACVLLLMLSSFVQRW